MRLSVIIPLFNEEAVIEDTNRRIIDVVGDLAGKRLIDDYEIIYVDDGSGDGSLNILKKFTETSPKIRGSRSVEISDISRICMSHDVGLLYKNSRQCGPRVGFNRHPHLVHRRAQHSFFGADRRVHWEDLFGSEKETPLYY